MGSRVLEGWVTAFQYLDRPSDGHQSIIGSRKLCVVHGPQLRERKFVRDPDWINGIGAHSIEVFSQLIRGSVCWVRGYLCTSQDLYGLQAFPAAREVGVVFFHEGQLFQRVGVGQTDWVLCEKCEKVLVEVLTELIN